MPGEDGEMSKKSVRVQRDGKGNWKVTKDGSKRASAVTDTQKEAIDRGKAIAKRDKTELVIHGTDGKIREKNSYGNDPHPPQG